MCVIFLERELWFLVLVQLNLVASLSEGSLVATSCSSQGNCTLGWHVYVHATSCVSPFSQMGVTRPLPLESQSLNQSSVMSSSYTYFPVIKSHAHLSVIKSHAHLTVIKSHTHILVIKSHAHLPVICSHTHQILSMNK